jgi:hypothetical protein
MREPGCNRCALAPHATSDRLADSGFNGGRDPDFVERGYETEVAANAYRFECARSVMARRLPKKTSNHTRGCHDLADSDRRDFFLDPRWKHLSSSRSSEAMGGVTCTGRRSIRYRLRRHGGLHWGAGRSGPHLALFSCRDRVSDDLVSNGSYCRSPAEPTAQRAYASFASQP